MALTRIDGRGRIPIATLVLIPALLSFCGCHDRQDPADSAAVSAPAGVEPAAASEAAPEASAGGTTTDPLDMTPANLEAAQQRLEAGEIDTAAADLLRMQMDAARFDAASAATYRDTLGRAMSAAMEAAQKGDPRGEAALQMLRAARRR